MPLTHTYQFRLEPAETVRAARHVQRRQPLAWAIWLVWPALAALTLLYWATGTPLRDLWLLGIVAGGLLGMQVIAPFVQRWQVGRAYAETPGLREPQRYELTTAGLVMAGGAASTTLGWDAILEVTETSEFYLFFYSKRCAYYLPKRVVGGAVDQRSLRTLLRTHLGVRAAGLQEERESALST